MIHLAKLGIPKEEVTEDVLPKGAPPFPGTEYMSCSGHVSLGMCEMTMGEMKEHVAKHADQKGNLWCHLEGYGGHLHPLPG